jgi:hypothetical protein
MAMAVVESGNENGGIEFGGRAVVLSVRRRVYHCIQMMIASIADADRYRMSMPSSIIAFIQPPTPSLSLPIIRPMQMPL